MRSRYSSLRVYVLALLIFTFCAATCGIASGQARLDRSIAVLTSYPHSRTSRKQLDKALRLSAMELHVADRPMPRVILLEAGKEEARVADVHGWGGLFVENRPDTSEPTYMVWFVGEPSDSDLIGLFVAVLNKHFRLQLTTTELSESAKRAASTSAAVTSVESLRSR